MLNCSLIWLGDLAFVNSKKRKKIEIKYLLRLLRRTFFRRVLPPISHLLVVCSLFSGILDTSEFFYKSFFGMCAQQSLGSEAPLSAPDRGHWRPPPSGSTACSAAVVRIAAAGLREHQSSSWLFFTFLSFFTHRTPVSEPIAYAWDAKMYLKFD